MSFPHGLESNFIILFDCLKRIGPLHQMENGEGIIASRRPSNSWNGKVGLCVNKGQAPLNICINILQGEEDKKMVLPCPKPKLYNIW